MAVEAKHALTTAPVTGARVGVVDIGSNSIRLVIYEGHRRTPLPVFNEKVLCGLGRGLLTSGRLWPEGVELALDSLARFAEMARVMAVGHLDVVATAAVREAADGEEFVARVLDRTGLQARVLSGKEEAEYSALGVISGIPDADGLMGDIGAGSLELAQLDKGRAGRQITLPLGPFRLGVMSPSARAGIEARIEAELAPLDWLAEARGRKLYLVGGNWRALGRIHIAQRDYPLRMIHHYALTQRDAISLAELVAGLGSATLARVEVVPSRRRDTVSTAALVLLQLLRAVKPRTVVFSADGLREGILFSHLPREIHRLDPLIEGCLSFAERLGNLAEYGRVLAEWTKPLFPEDGPAGARLRLAACLLADVAWREYPDFRAEHAFQQVLRLQVVGVDHPGRAFLALAVASRYKTSFVGNTSLTSIAAMLEDERREQAKRLGLAIRLADRLCGGNATTLSQTALRVAKKTLTLDCRPGAEALIGETVERRLRSLAVAMELEPAIGPQPAD